MYVCHAYKCPYEHVLSMKNNVVCLVDALGFLTSHDFVVFPTFGWFIRRIHLNDTYQVRWLMNRWWRLVNFVEWCWMVLFVCILWRRICCFQPTITNITKRITLSGSQWRQHHADTGPLPREDMLHGFSWIFDREKEWLGLRENLQEIMVFQSNMEVSN